MIDAYAKLKFFAVRAENELQLLEELVFELTHVVRIVCHDEVLSRDEQLAGLKQLNEISLRVLNIILQIHKGETWLHREGTWDMICNHVKRAPHITDWVDTAIFKSLQSVNVT